MGLLLALAHYTLNGIETSAPSRLPSLSLHVSHSIFLSFFLFSSLPKNFGTREWMKRENVCVANEGGGKVQEGYW